MNLCGLLLYALVSTASSQERDRLWHSTTPGPIPLSVTSDSEPTSPSPVVPSTESAPVAVEPAGDSGPVVPAEVVAPAESPAPQPDTTRGGSQDVQDVLTTQEKKTPEEVKKEPLVAAEGKKDKKERKWMSTPKEEIVIKEENSTTEENKKEEPLVAVEDKKEKKERKWMSAPKEEIVTEKEKVPELVLKEERKMESEQETKKESIDESQNISAEMSTEEGKPKNKKKKPRKWMSVPGMAIEEEAPSPSTNEDIALAEESLDLAQQAVIGQPSSPFEAAPGGDVHKYSINPLDMELPENITELLLAAEEGVPLIQEIFVSKKTTVYVTISDSLEAEPLFVNLTGIRHYTGEERRMVGGVLDLSDLMITGEDAKEVIQRMSKHKFHKIDLSNNNITEFPANTFSPVAFTVRELRLDGNPLASNDQGEASVLQRGGLFHLTELRELNLSSCGLQDMDYFTPWNSNHLEVVDLSNNKLTTVPSNLQFFHKLKKLYLDGNPIKRVTELPFALLWNIQILSLSDCQVATIIDDPFRNMDKLKELSLEGNNLTQIGQVRLPRSNSGVKMFLSGNPWHCACEMLNFIEHYHYAIRDIEYIRCASPRWLEGLRTAYLTKEILSLDSIDGDCTPQSPRVSANHQMPPFVPVYTPTFRADRLQLLALIVFVMAALFMLCHVLWSRKKDKYRFEDDRDDIHYIRIDKKPSFK